MSKFRGLQGLVFALVGWVALFVPQLDAVAAASVTGTQLVSSVRTGRTTFDFSYQVTVQNGTPALTAASVTVTSSSPATVVIKGSAALGNLGANSTVTSTDVVTIRQDRTVPFNAPALTWVVTGTPVISNVTVPNVVNLTQAAAATAITGAGLAVGTVTTSSSPTVPAGSVISQNPTGGTSVAPGSAVNLVVSTGPAPVVVPNVVNQTQAAATTAITGVGLVVGTVTTANSTTVPSGSVISQNPPGGTSVVPGSAVNLVVSTGPAPVVVPNVVNQTQAAATTAITGAGLVVGTVTTANSATVPSGSVISQNPTGGTSVAPGSAVSFVVSTGPVPVVVPNVVNQTQAAATTAITGAGLVVGTVTTSSNPTVPAGSVISQNPTGGTSVARGSAVNLVVSTGVAQVSVPGLGGLTQAAATSAITNAGLTVGTITMQLSASVPAGIVISQNPTFGTLVAPGSAVSFVVSLGQSTVPSIGGLTQANATSAITTAGLTVGTITQQLSAIVPAGIVISQSPAGGTAVVPGSAVNFVVSLGQSTVPSIGGLTQAAATSAITAANLTVGTITTQSSATVPSGIVISQNPTGGTLVAPGTSVSFVVSTGPATVTVPNVVNLTQAGASSALIGAGLTVGPITLTNSPTVPAGSVISQNPAAGASVVPGTAVSLTVSVGPTAGGPVPASIQLRIGTLVVAAAGSTPITTVVLDASNQPIVPTPAVTYTIATQTGNAGALPTTASPAGVLSLLAGADTRGAYTLRASVDSTAITASVNFAVIEATPPAGATLSNGERLVAFGTAETTVAGKLSAISAAISANQTSLIPALNAALQASAAGVPVTGRNGLERTTPVAPDLGFLPGTGLLASSGFPQTAGDVTFGNLVTQIDAKVTQLTAYYATLDPASATNDDATLTQLNADLNGLLTQLLAVTVTPYGVVDNAPRLNLLLAQTLPGNLQALSSRINTVLVANQLASAQTTSTEFYAGLANSDADQNPLDPNGFYRQPQPAFFGLIGLMAGSSLQMNLVNQIYGKILQEVTRMMVILAVNSLLQPYTNGANMEGLISGASLSFQAPNLPGSVIEGEGWNVEPKRNDVYFVGPEAVSAVQGVLTSFDPRGIKSLKDLYDFFDKIVGALQDAGKAYDNAHKVPDQVNTGGCILDFGENGSCSQLEYDSGFPDVNDTRFPSPVIVLVHNLDSGVWAQGIFNFVP